MKSLLKPTFASVMAAVSIGLAISAQAQDGKPEKKPDAPAKAEAHAALLKAKPYGGTLSAVDKTAMTITVKKKEAEKTFLVTSSTKITKAGKPATLEDGVIGDEAGISYVEADGGKVEAKSIRFGAKPAKASGEKEKSNKAEKKGDKETNSPAKN